MYNEPMDNALGVGQWILHNPAWTDAIIALGMVIYGSATILVSVYLAINHDIEWTRLFAIVLGVMIIEDVFWYYLGQIMRHTRFGWRFYKKHKSNKRTQAYLHYLKKNISRISIVSRFLPGGAITVVFLIGWSRTKISRFLKVDMASIALWFGSMTVVSYFLMSGLHYLHSEEIFRNVEIGIAAAVLVFVFGGQIFRKLFGKYVGLELKAEEFGKKVEEAEKETQEQKKNSVQEKVEKI